MGVQLGPVRLHQKLEVSRREPGRGENLTALTHGVLDAASVSPQSLGRPELTIVVSSGRRRQSRKTPHRAAAHRVAEREDADEPAGFFASVVTAPVCAVALSRASRVPLYQPPPLAGNEDR